MIEPTLLLQLCASFVIVIVMPWLRLRGRRLEARDELFPTAAYNHFCLLKIVVAGSVPHTI
jgi:hypothetical protein